MKNYDEPTVRITETTFECDWVCGGVPHTFVATRTDEGLHLITRPDANPLPGFRLPESITPQLTGWIKALYPSDGNDGA